MKKTVSNKDHNKREVNYIKNSEQVRTQIDHWDAREVFTPREIMGKIFASKNKVYELLRTGQLKSFRIGKHYRIYSKDLEIYIKNNETYSE